MSNASSKFLRGANTGGPPIAAVPPDENAVLATASKPQITNTAAVAMDLGTTVQAVAPIVDSLVRSGLLKDAPGTGLELTAAGMRALRYASVAKF